MAQAVDGKPKRIKNILDYLQQDVPKTGTEAVQGEDMGKAPDANVNIDTTEAVPISNNDKPKRKPNPKFFS